VLSSDELRSRVALSADVHDPPAPGIAGGRGSLRRGLLTTGGGRGLRPWAEIALVVLGALVFACWSHRDALSALTTTAAGDLGDPLYFAWQLAWVSHALASAPTGLWTTNAFLQEPGSLAFTDTVLGYAPLGLVVPSGQAGALAQLNLALMIATTLATVGGYAIARAMGAGPVGSLVAAAGFGYAPWRLQQVIHINILSTGGIALALALLLRGSGWSLRDGWRPDRMSARWIAAGWAVAVWQLTFGFAIGIWFAYSLAVPLALLGLGWVLRGRRRAGLPRRVVLAHGIGGAAFVGAAALLVQPYLQVIAAHPEAKRGENWLPLFSPPWRGLLTAPETSWFWGDRQVRWRSALSWPPEMVLSPGIVLLVLAAVGLVFSVWSWRRRLGLAAATVALTVLALGTQFVDGGRWTYLPLYRHLPGWDALRTPGRLIIWVTLGLCLLAAGAVARFAQAFRPRARVRPSTSPRRGTPPRRGPRAVTASAVVLVFALLPTAAVLAEGAGQAPQWPVSRSPVRLAELPGPVLLLPSDEIADYHMMLWSTEGWPVIANGSSGFQPVEQVALRQEVGGFPDAASLAALRRRGILSVVVIRSRAFETPWSDAASKPVAGLPVRRTVLGDAVVFDLRPQQ
jgi:hypothetical protein